MESISETLESADEPNLEQMPEAEVSLRLALYLLVNDRVTDDVSVAIDGAQVQVAGRVIFDVHRFLSSRCHAHVGDGWRGRYQIAGTTHGIEIHSTAGKGDVVATLKDNTRLLVECKKGPLMPSKSSSEYPILREAIGQIVTNAPGTGERLAVAVPHSGRFVGLTAKWRDAPLLRMAGISLLTVTREDEVFGWPADLSWATTPRTSPSLGDQPRVS